MDPLKVKGRTKVSYMGNGLYRNKNDGKEGNKIVSKFDFWELKKRQKIEENM